MSDLTLLENIAVAAAGAFFGALCGYLAVAIEKRVDRRRDRRKAHRNCLVAIEKDGNRVLGLLHENQFEIRCIKNAVARHEDSTSVPLVLDRCTTIPVNPAHWNDLRNINLINDVFQYEQNIRKFNASASTINHFLDLFTQALIAKTVDDDTYRVNLGRCIEILDQISPFINDLIEETFRLIAAARLILSDDKTLLERLGIHSGPQEYTPEFRRRVEAEVVVLKKEVEEVSSKDRKRIDRITGRGEGDQRPRSPQP